MKLESLQVKNFRSLEDISLEHIDTYNALIGRNNAGKSSILYILNRLRACIGARAPSLEGWSWEHNLISRNDKAKLFEVKLRFSLNELDRRRIISATETLNDERIKGLLET